MKMFSDSGIGQAVADEARLIARARLGDGEAFAALVDSYKRLVYWHISHSASFVSAADEEDLYQEGLVGLLKAVRTYDGVSSAFATYASSCICHSVISAARRLRKQNGDVVPLDDTELVSGSSPESDLLDRESISLLYERVFSQLSGYERSVFELYLSDRSYADIARVMGKTEKSIANAICRIRRKLKKLLG
ncbi:MAG: sigma-70 family RNA polymerase sigma factor [Clostridia bacterium]|nr:sigma-70 family RNA polymerase sigma factor [Clostridia bacterium]MBO7158636.1 sigma-70 family RNA polymerase sigma factor [Clostridia bacterium]MBQ1254863.1 sigma-70 family RNA polymerase sigma factor [Clostridia bacterium]MBQ2255164.1 sigma-70 family RNA polymerase sigma factor [Clostridia bacterium]MBQ5791931.1 sigma-70 family RNA polymerase sigma factor [Clostridia bacterium]